MNRMPGRWAMSRGRLVRDSSREAESGSEAGGRSGRASAPNPHCASLSGVRGKECQPSHQLGNFGLGGAWGGKYQPLRGH